MVNGGVYNLKLVNSKIEGKGYVGGIAGNLAAGTVHWNVSNAKVSSTNGTVAYEVGNKASGATMEWNFYIGKEAKINDNDTHTYKITLHPNLNAMGFAFNISKDHDFDVSGVTIDANATVKVGDDMYGEANKHIDFSIPDISGGCKVENLRQLLPVYLYGARGQGHLEPNSLYGFQQQAVLPRCRRDGDRQLLPRHLPAARRPCSHRPPAPPNWPPR